VVDQVLVAQRDAEHALHQHRFNAVLNLALDPTIGEAGGKPPHQTDRPIGGAQQQRPRLRGDRAAVERSLDPTALDPSIPEQLSATLCRHRGPPLNRLNCLSQNNYHRYRAPMHLLL
jgi:hypothetical protein